MNKIKKEVHSIQMEKELFEIMEQNILLGTMTIKVEQGLPICSK